MFIRRRSAVSSIMLAALALVGCRDAPSSSAAPSAAPDPVQSRTEAGRMKKMDRTAKERSSAYELVWSLSTTSDGSALKLDYAITAHEELYIADRLWDQDAERKRIADPYGVYRFVRGDSLRLVFAKAPAPPNVRVGNPYRPLYSRVRAGETKRNTVLIKLPVDEYSALARDVASPTVVEEVSKVVFVLGYCPRSAMESDPAPPLNETAEKAGYVVYEERLLVSEMQVEKLPVKRRTGYIARFPLPGEPGPEPMPAPR